MVPVFSILALFWVLIRVLPKPQRAAYPCMKVAIDEPPVAISFAFPGPADYPNGIIDNSNNLPAFKGGVPLKSILEEEFGLPVFIINDGDLFAYGEALGGILPEINARLEANGSPNGITTSLDLPWVRALEADSYRKVG